jgi:hypothetical protein
VLEVLVELEVEVDEVVEVEVDVDEVRVFPFLEFPNLFLTFPKTSLSALTKSTTSFLVGSILETLIFISPVNSDSVSRCLDILFPFTSSSLYLHPLS